MVGGDNDPADTWFSYTFGGRNLPYMVTTICPRCRMILGL